MIAIQGLYNTAVCYTPQLEEAAERQIRAVCDRPEFTGCKIRIMAYKSMDQIVAQIGPTADIVERILPVYNFKAAD